MDRPQLTSRLINGSIPYHHSFRSEQSFLGEGADWAEPFWFGSVQFVSFVSLSFCRSAVGLWAFLPVLSLCSLHGTSCSAPECSLPGTGCLTQAEFVRDRFLFYVSLVVY